MTRADLRARARQREELIRLGLSARRPRPRRRGSLLDALVLALLTLLAGCAEHVPPHAEVEAVEIRVRQGPEPEAPTFLVYRFDDEETGATCYVLGSVRHPNPSIACVTGAAGD